MEGVGNVATQMIRMGSAAAKQKWGEVIHQIGRGKHIILTKYRRPEAVVLRWEDYKRLCERAGLPVKE